MVNSLRNAPSSSGALSGARRERVSGGGEVAVLRDDARTVFHTLYGMSPECSDSRADPGSWMWIGPPVSDGEGSLFYPPMEVSATTGSTVALGGDAVYVSRDLGAADLGVYQTAG